MIETTTFRLADGVGDDDFLDADEALRTGFLYHQPGMARATTARGDDGEWILVVLWASGDDAVAAEARAEGDSRVRRFTKLVDPATSLRRRYRTFD